MCLTGFLGRAGSKQHTSGVSKKRTSSRLHTGGPRRDMCVYPDVRCNCACLMAAPQNDGANEQTIIDIMINQALSLGLSEDETDDYVQQIAITLLAGEFRIT